MTAEQINKYLSAQQQMGVYTSEVAEFAKEELNKLRYRSDLKYSDLNTCIRNANIQLTNSRNLDNSSGLVWVDFHLGARPSHAEWHGKVYSLDGEVTINGVTYGDFYEECRVGEPVTGFGGINCRHYTIPWDASWEVPEDGDNPVYPDIPDGTPDFKPPTPKKRKELGVNNDDDWWWYMIMHHTMETARMVAKSKTEEEWRIKNNEYYRECQEFNQPYEIQKTWNYTHMELPKNASESFRGIRMPTNEAGIIRCSATAFALRLLGYMLMDRDLSVIPSVDDVFLCKPNTVYNGRTYLTDDGYIYCNDVYYNPLTQRNEDVPESSNRKFYNIDSLTVIQKNLDKYFRPLLYKTTYSENRKSR